MKNSVNTHALRAARVLCGSMDRLGEFLPQLGLRFLLAFEFWESGIEKVRGENWFADIQDRFPF
jgi:putative oxidoreductase